jgi:hypothetical protein
MASYTETNLKLIALVLLSRCCATIYFARFSGICNIVLEMITTRAIDLVARPFVIKPTTKGPASPSPLRSYLTCHCPHAPVAMIAFMSKFSL